MNSPYYTRKFRVRGTQEVENPQSRLLNNMFFNTNKATWDCGLCRKGFREKKDLEQHLSSGTHDEITCTCNHCGKGFSNAVSLTLHKSQAKHSDDDNDHLSVASRTPSASLSQFNDYKHNLVSTTRQSTHPNYSSHSMYFGDHSSETVTSDQIYHLHVSSFQEKHTLEAGCGYMITDSAGDIIMAEDGFVMNQIYPSSLQPDYEALSEGLSHALELGIRQLVVSTSNELLYIQMNTGQGMACLQTFFRMVETTFVAVKKLCLEFQFIAIKLVNTSQDLLSHCTEIAEYSFRTSREQRTSNVDEILNYGSDSTTVQSNSTPKSNSIPSLSPPLSPYDSPERYSRKSFSNPFSMPRTSPSLSMSMSDMAASPYETVRKLSALDHSGSDAGSHCYVASRDKPHYESEEHNRGGYYGDRNHHYGHAAPQVCAPVHPPARGHYGYSQQQDPYHPASHTYQQYAGYENTGFNHSSYDNRNADSSPNAYPNHNAYGYHNPYDNHHAYGNGNGYGYPVPHSGAHSQYAMYGSEIRPHEKVRVVPAESRVLRKKFGYLFEVL